MGDVSAMIVPSEPDAVPAARRGTPPYLDQQYLGGWRRGSSARRLEVRDPFTRDVVTSFPMATTGDVDEAYQRAAEAQTTWANTPPSARRSVLAEACGWISAHRAEIRDLITREIGGTRAKANFEIDLAADLVRTAAAMTDAQVGQLLPAPDADHENRVYRDPVGVVGVISPFNVPFFLSLKAAAPALALGNAVVIKPHELAPITGGTLIAEMFADCGLPPGLLNVVVTDIDEIGDTFVEHPVPSTIVFTGSTRTGRHIAEVAGRNLKKVILELGGNSAFIVLDDADIQRAIESAIPSRFINAGQVCMAANRFIVDAQIHDVFLERFVGAVGSLPVGDPRDEATVVGPLISPGLADVLDGQVETAIAHGARYALGPGDRRPDSGLYSPVILADVTEANPVSQVELFGPVACVLKARDEEDAIRLANATPYGLSGAVHTTDLDRGVRVARRINTGMAHVNDTTVADEPAVPFGGVGASGYGRLNGAASVEAFTRLTWLRIHHRDAPTGGASSPERQP